MFKKKLNKGDGIDPPNNLEKVPNLIVEKESAEEIVEVQKAMQVEIRSIMPSNNDYMGESNNISDFQDGGPDQGRTGDTSLFRRVLYQLSYRATILDKQEKR